MSDYRWWLRVCGRALAASAAVGATGSLVLSRAERLLDGLGEVGDLFDAPEELSVS